jgi:hypothetical protein
MRSRRTSPVESDEIVVCCKRTTPRSKVRGKTANEAVNKHTPVGSSGAPGNKPPVNFSLIHRELGKIGYDKIEAPTLDGFEHLPVMHFEISRMALQSQKPSRGGNRIGFDIDTAEMAGTRAASRCQQDTAPAPYIQDICATGPFSTLQDAVNHRRRITAWTKLPSGSCGVELRHSRPLTISLRRLQARPWRRGG